MFLFKLKNFTVSLARRIQEPLAELVKVEPKHLGVGMYQHDLPKKQLEQALDEVVMECVSFVGVDLNTASQCLLKLAIFFIWLTMCFTCFTFLGV